MKPSEGKLDHIEAIKIEFGDPLVVWMLGYIKASKVELDK